MKFEGRSGKFEVKGGLQAAYCCLRFVRAYGKLELTVAITNVHLD